MRGGGSEEEGERKETRWQTSKHRKKKREKKEKGKGVGREVWSEAGIQSAPDLLLRLHGLGGIQKTLELSELF